MKKVNKYIKKSYAPTRDLRGASDLNRSPGIKLGSKSLISEPHQYVSGGNFSGKKQPDSPDPFVSYRWDNPKASDLLQIFLCHPTGVKTENAGSFNGVETLITDQQEVEVLGTGMILLDFGVELAGWLEIDSPDLTGTVSLGISEYNEPAIVNTGPQSPSKMAVPVKYGNTYRLELNSELYEGVRFGFINVTEFDKAFHINGVRLICQIKPVNYEGSFHSNIEMLNRIWYTAAYDVRVNLKEDHFAAILMDRGDRHSWTGDAYPAQAAALIAFGNYDFVLQNLRYTAIHTNGIESFELYWIFSLIDYYKHTGDRKGVNDLLPQAMLRLKHAYDIYAANPPLGFFGWDERLGAGFENPDIEANQISYQLLALEAWSQFSIVSRDIGRSDLADTYEGYVKEKLRDLLREADWYRGCGLHTSADAINAGVVSADIMKILYHKNFTDRVNRLSYSPFNQYFILKAMGKAGQYDHGISCVLDMWGGQIEYGGTTFFETYRPGWNDEINENDPVPNNQAGYTSLAHPWGAGVLPWLSEEVLGIKATSPGFRTFDIKPHLGRQVTRVSGSTPTPYGTIEASFNTETGECKVIIPEGTTAKIGIPKVEKAIIDIRMNDRQAAVLGEDFEFVYLTELKSGTYVFQVDYEGQTPEYAESEYTYAAEFVREDAETKGNWSGVYGTEGYDFFSYNGRGKDLENFPDYVADIRYNKANAIQWVSKTGEVRALPSNTLNIGNRKLGALYTNDPIACQQTFTLDIFLKTSRRYTVALYFADWDNTRRRLAVEMFDKDTLNMVAPVKIVDNYSKGKYLVYRYDKSVRFRINQIRGANATLSAVFFGI